MAVRLQGEPAPLTGKCCRRLRQREQCCWYPWCCRCFLHRHSHPRPRPARRPPSSKQKSSSFFRYTSMRIGTAPRWISAPRAWRELYLLSEGRDREGYLDEIVGLLDDIHLEVVALLNVVDRLHVRGHLTEGGIAALEELSLVGAERAGQNEDLTVASHLRTSAGHGESARL